MGAKIYAVFLMCVLFAQRTWAAETFQDITVRPGDTLWSIAQTYLKDPTRWNAIVRHNRLPTSDPTVALPGMSLRVPVELIKEELRAAKLVHLVRRVLCRLKDTAAWKDSKLGQQLFRGDGLRTLADSWARVQFLDGSLLSLDPNSMVILKPPKQEDHELRLLSGGVHATLSRVVTPSAHILPKTKDTKYSARVLEDLSTRVQVYTGIADVSGAGQTVELRGGYATEVPLGRTPSPPVKIRHLKVVGTEDASDFMENARPGPGQARVGGTSLVHVRSQRSPAADGSAEAKLQTRIEVDSTDLQIGIPIAAYHIQVSLSSSFDKIVFQGIFDPQDSIDLRRHRLRDGKYWVRVAPVDLLGTRGKYSEPKLYTFGAVQSGD